MLRFLTTIGVCLWIVLGIAWFVSLAPTATDQPPKNNGEAQQSREDSKKNKTSVVSVIEVRSWDFVHTYKDETTAASTLIIAIFTIILGVFTVRLSGSTRIAAVAASRSADAAVAMELPWLRVDVPNELEKVNGPQDDWGGLIWDVETAELPEYSKISEIDFRNIGRTVAAPVKLELGYKVVRELPRQEPSYTWGRQCDHGTVILPDNQTVTIECAGFCISLTAGERASINDGRAILWVFGALSYIDFLQQPHTCRFCWRWGCQDGVGLYHFYKVEGMPPEYTAKS
jgi:hypothetical protein